VFCSAYLTFSSDILKDQYGHQTAAFAVNGGEEMLTGNPAFGNSGEISFPNANAPKSACAHIYITVQSLSTTTPQDINSMPTIEGIYDVAKELNGIGNISNSFFAETFASSFASALFDHNQMQEVASVPEFNIPSSEFPSSRIASSLRTVAQNMRVSTETAVIFMVFNISVKPFML
jgi:hypothetical protein